jgi:hypothetical protein
VRCVARRDELREGRRPREGVRGVVQCRLVSLRDGGEVVGLRGCAGGERVVRGEENWGGGREGEREEGKEREEREEEEGGWLHAWCGWCCWCVGGLGVVLLCSVLELVVDWRGVRKGAYVFVFRAGGEPVCRLGLNMQLFSGGRDGLEAGFLLREPWIQNQITAYLVCRTYAWSVPQSEKTRFGRGVIERCVIG